MSNKLRATQNSTSRHRKRLLRAAVYWGIYARVARRLHLGKTGRAHVWRVAMGQRKSERVIAALLEEIQRIERRAA